VNNDLNPLVKIYRPNQRHELGFFRTWTVMVRNVVRSRELIWQLFKRDFLAGYKKSFLGVTWIFLSPILGIVSWTFLNSTGMFDPGELEIPYPVYVLMGTTMWSLFIGFYDAAKKTLSSGSALVMQVNYPHEALLFKQTAQHLADFSLKFVVVMILMVTLGLMPHWQAVLFPLTIIPLFFMGAGIGLVVSMIEVVAVDLDRIITLGMGLLLWATPIIYADTVDNPIVQAVIKVNPLTYLVGSARDIILYGRLYNVSGFFLFTLVAVILFLISWRLFYVSEDKIIERMI